MRCIYAEGGVRETIEQLQSLRRTSCGLLIGKVGLYRRGECTDVIYEHTSYADDLNI